MAFTVTNDFSGQTLLDPDELDANFTDIETVLNKGITTSHISDSANIPNAALANDDFEIVLTTMLNGDELHAALNSKIPLGGMPYDATGGTASYVVLGIETSAFFATAAGGLTELQGSIRYGRIDGVGASTEIVTTFDSGTATACSLKTLAASAITVSSTDPKCFYWLIDQAGAGFQANDDFFGIAIKVKRTSGLRA